MIEAMIEEGTTAIDALPEHAKRITGLLSTHFPAQTLEAVHAAMRPSVEGARSATNQKVAELSSLVREEAAVLAAQLRQCGMWLRLKQPAVSDGNNFGVDVQNYVLEELNKMLGSVEHMLVAGRDYYWSRAQGLEKLFGDEKIAESSKDGTDVKDGKSETSKSTSTVKTVSKPAAYPDYQEYVVCVDVRQYHLMFNHLTDMRNCYLKAHVLFSKNMKKLTDPRGDGEGRSAHSMSMF